MRFRLGYVAEPLTGHEDWLEGKLAIPYLSRAGVVEIKFRSIDGTEPKYIYSAGSTSERIYNPTALFDDRDFICVCEGEVDAITAEQAGLPAVAIPGVKNWKPYFARCFAGYRDVFILADSDDEGQGSAFATALAKLIENAKVVAMPPGHDVNSFFLDSGAEGLRRKVGLE